VSWREVVLYELIPLFAGCVVGAAIVRLDQKVARAAVLVAASLIAAIAAGALSGELEESPAFLIWDTVQALAAALATAVAIHSYTRRRARGDG
jgi:hypothetical protein